MIDKILKAARILAAKRTNHNIRVSTDDAGDQQTTVILGPEQGAAFVGLLELVADYFNPGRAAGGGLCRKCGAPLLWVKTTSGANAPLDPVMISGIDADGVAHRVYLNHFSTCPHADEVRAEKAARDYPEDGKSKAGR